MSRPLKPVTREVTPKGNLPYRNINQPFRFQFVIPGSGIEIEQDANGVCYISATGGAGVADLVAGDNIEITREDGKVIISAVDTITNVSAGQNVEVNIDPNTGTVTISSIVGDQMSEHYKGVFDTVDALLAADPQPENGDYGLVKNLVFADGEQSWNGQYKYCFYISGQWTVVDQMLTFTDDLSLLRQYYSVGGSSPTIYLHEVARTGSYNSLSDKPIVATPTYSKVGDTHFALACSTEGAEIFYTVDGSTPYPWGQNAYKYTDPLLIIVPNVVRAVAVKNGMINSEELYLFLGDEYEAPTISLNYTTGIAHIHNPNSSVANPRLECIINGESQTFNALDVYINLTGTTTISAVATDANHTYYSNMVTETYQQVRKPRLAYSGYNFRPDNGFNVYDCLIETNVELRYSLDQNDPTYISESTDGTINFDHIYVEIPIKVRAYKINMVPSEVLDSSYGLGDPDAPVITYDPDTMLVTMQRMPNSADHYGNTLGLDDEDYEIRYTTDGSTPTAESTLYTGPFTPEQSGTIKARLIAYGEYNSAVSSLQVSVLEPPYSTLDYRTGMVAMYNRNNTGTIHYTLDGSTPTSESTAYTDVIFLTETTTLKMIVVQGSGSSAVATVTYNKADAPYIDLGSPNMLAGYYDIAIISGQQGAQIHYTDNGNTPTYLSDQYGAPVRVGIFSGVQLKAISLVPGYLPSAVASTELPESVDAPAILINEETVQLSFALSGYSALIPLQTNNNAPELGARIYYTLDGSTPTASNGTLWDGTSIKYHQETVKAVTVCYGQYSSDVSSYVPITPLYLSYDSPVGSVANPAVRVNSNLDTPPDIYYSVGNTRNWTKLKFSFTGSGFVSDDIPFSQSGDIVYFKGTNARLSFVDTSKYTTFVIDGAKAYAGGTVQSLVDGVGESETAIQMSRLFASANIISAPDLPATTLSRSCYEGIFDGCQYLVQGTYLPATRAAENCYKNMYKSCSALTYANAIMLSTLAISCCEAMFYGCSALTTAPDLGAMTMYPSCYKQMFAMSGLTAAPQLPADRVAQDCYAEMFASCYSLTTAMATLPAMTAAQGCYQRMFMYNRALTVAPTLPATTLAADCYSQMFFESGLTAAPDLPAETMQPRCYESMFRNCYSLTRATSLTAMVLAEQCYSYMFCYSSITSAPYLPATSLAPYCYEGMFAYTQLVAFGQLPAVNLAVHCYDSMFKGSTIENIEPGIGGLVLPESACESMFEDCSHLNVNSNIINSSVYQYGNSCCKAMFKNSSVDTCVDFSNVTTIGDHCCESMYEGCEYLETASVPPASLSPYCYKRMFAGSNVTHADLPAVMNASYAYMEMFSGCANMSYVICYLNYNFSNTTQEWLADVAPEGTLLVPDRTLWPGDDTSGCPPGWETMNI